MARCSSPPCDSNFRAVSPWLPENRVCFFRYILSLERSVPIYTCRYMPISLSYPLFQRSTHTALTRFDFDSHPLLPPSLPSRSSFLTYSTFIDSCLHAFFHYSYFVRFSCISALRPLRFTLSPMDTFLYNIHVHLRLHPYPYPHFKTHPNH